MASGAAVTAYDSLVQETLANSSTITGAVFTGPHAEQAYGALLGTNIATPVPLTLLPGNAENIYHFANASSDLLGSDLMNGIGLQTGAANHISVLDLAVLARAIG